MSQRKKTVYVLMGAVRKTVILMNVFCENPHGKIMRFIKANLVFLILKVSLARI